MKSHAKGSNWVKWSWYTKIKINNKQRKKSGQAGAKWVKERNVWVGIAMVAVRWLCCRNQSQAVFIPSCFLSTTHLMYSCVCLCVCTSLLLSWLAYSFLVKHVNIIFVALWIDLYFYSSRWSQVRFALLWLPTWCCPPRMHTFWNMRVSSTPLNCCDTTPSKAR